MSYLPVPAATGDTLDGTRDQIRNNFTKIQTDFAVNHVGFNITDEGKHKFIQMPVQGSAPTANASEGTLYSADVSGIAQLFFRGETSGSSYQLTTATSGVDANIASFGTIAGTNSSGWTFLPGGLFLQYGIRSVAKNTSSTVTFPKTFATAVYSITTTQKSNSVGSSGQGNVETITTSTFKIFNSSGNAKIYFWQAIGK